MYGKNKSRVSIKGFLGKQNVLFEKADSKAIEVRYSYSLGALVGFAKPYYLNVYKNPGSKQEEAILFTDEGFNPDSTSVIGRAPYLEGLSELKVYPGLTGKFNLSFEYSSYTNIIRAIETGVCIDYFPKALPLWLRTRLKTLLLPFTWVLFLEGNGTKSYGSDTRDSTT